MSVFGFAGKAEAFADFAPAHAANEFSAIAVVIGEAGVGPDEDGARAKSCAHTSGKGLQQGILIPTR